MKAMRWYIAVAATAAFLAGCGTYGNVGVSKYTGFVDLPFPSNTYTAGQIIEIYSNPRKIEITYDPRISWDSSSLSDGWNITADTTRVASASLEAKIAEILNASAGPSGSRRVTVTFTDVKTRIVEKFVIYETIKRSLSENQALADMMRSYGSQGTHYDVITQTLSARVSFTVSDSSGASVKLDPEILQKLNASVGVDFSLQSEKDIYITGGELVVGFHYDPGMVDALLPK